MPIKKKDGSDYKLSGPNPLLIGQERWDTDPVFRIHNFANYKPEVYEIDQPEFLPAKEFVEVSSDVITVELTKRYEPEPSPPTPPPEPEVKVVVEQPKPQPVVEKPKVTSQYRAFTKVRLFCLPSKIEEIYDDFYRENRTHVAYKSPFKFEATVVKFTDIHYMVWTTVDKMGKYSILFDGDARRWWKVGQVIPDPSGDGVLVHCSISDLEPDFSSLG